MNKKLNQFKKSYWQIKLSDQEIDKGWQDLQSKIQPPAFYWFFRQRFILAGLIIVFGLTAGVVSTASPVSPLYPVRVLADKVLAKVARRPEIKLERRADDVVNSVSEPERLNKASKEYNQALDEVREEVSKGTERKILQNGLMRAEEKKENSGLQKGLNKAEERLDQSMKNEPKSEKQVGPILEKTREFKEELQEKSKPKK